MRNAKYKTPVTCANCGRLFYAARSTAKYHDDACRLQAFRAKEKTGGNTWHDVSEDTKQKAMIIHRLSVDIYEKLCVVLEVKGANELYLYVDIIYDAVYKTAEMGDDARGLWI